MTSEFEKHALWVLGEHQRLRPSRPFFQMRNDLKRMKQNTARMLRLERILHAADWPSITLTVGAAAGNPNRATSGYTTITRRKGESQAAFQRRAAKAFPYADAIGGLLLMRTIIFCGVKLGYVDCPTYLEILSNRSEWQPTVRGP